MKRALNIDAKKAPARALEKTPAQSVKIGLMRHGRYLKNARSTRRRALPPPLYQVWLWRTYRIKWRGGDTDVPLGELINRHFDGIVPEPAVLDVEVELQSTISGPPLPLSTLLFLSHCLGMIRLVLCLNYSY